MKVQIYGKNITVTPAIAEKIEKKLNLLNKYFIIAEEDTANVVVRVYPNKQKIEVTIPTKYAVLRAEVVHDDLYAAIDLAVDKLEDQIRRQKTRLERKNKTKLAAAFIDPELLGEEYNENDDEVVRTKTIEPDMMDLDEAGAVLPVLEEYRVPVILDADFGHLPPAIPLICGSMAEIGGISGKITISMSLC